MTPQDSSEARITRYDMVTNFRCGESIDELERADNGEWVRWEDVEGRLHEQAQEIERVNALLRVTTGHEGGGSITCGHCGHRIASDGVIEALTAEIKRAEAAEARVRALQEQIDKTGHAS